MIVNYDPKSFIVQATECKQNMTSLREAGKLGQNEVTKGEANITSVPHEQICEQI
jgi:hypothetical protein